MQNNTIAQPPDEPTPSGIEAELQPQVIETPAISLPPEPQPADETEISPQDISEPPKYRSGGWRAVASTIAILVAAPLIALFLTTFVFQSYEVDGPSMEQTLQDNDRLIVLKTGKTWARLTGRNYIPSRGEIIIFHRRGLYSYDENLDKQLIKRVIALPGERVVVKDGVIVVFNFEHPEGFQPDNDMPYGKSIVTTPGEGEFVVGEGQVFVSGDNRPNSLDSREFGPIDSDDIVGRLALRIFPLNKFDSF